MTLDLMLAQCVAAPEDDTPRLVWADAAGGERGELVMLQCSEPTPERRRRERELLVENELAWSGLDGIADRVAFDRGFPVAIQVDLAMLADHLDEIFDIAPFVDSISITGFAREYEPETRATVTRRNTLETIALIERVLGSPRFAARIAALDVIDDTPIDDAGIDLVNAAGVAIASWKPPRLSAIGVSGRQWYEASAGELMSSALEHATRVEKLWLRDHQMTTQDVAFVSMALPNLVAVDLEHRVGPPLDATMLGPLFALPLVELAMSWMTAAGLWTIANSPAAATIEHLALDRANLGIARVAILEMFPRLTSLELGFVHEVSDRTFAEFARVRLPNVRELHIASHATPETRLAIAERFPLYDDRSSDHALIRPIGPRTQRRLPPAAREHLVDIATHRTWDLPRIQHVRIGRAFECHVQIDDALVSRHHVVLTWNGGQHVLQNVGDNGTYVNGTLATTATPLRDGDVIAISSVKLRYFVGVSI